MMEDINQKRVDDALAMILSLGASKMMGDTFVIIDTCIQLFDNALQDAGVYDNMIFGNPEHRSRFIDAAYQGYLNWKKVVKILNDKYHQEQVNFTYLMIALYMTEVDYMPSELKELMEESISTIIAREENELKAEISDVDSAGKPSMTDDEMAKLFINADKNLVSEFFNTFSSMKTFRRDISKYDSEEEVEKHKKLMWIYSQMLTGSDNR